MKREQIISQSGFTLVEMLIVVAVLGVLIGLLAPAILKNIDVAQRKARANECAVLEGAIFEFWHDQNRWPIKVGAKPTINKDDKNLSYKLIYGEKPLYDNFEVFNQLVKADFGGGVKNKDYIDMGRHITTSVKETSYPSFSAAPLRDVFPNGQIDRPLVYWAKFIKCPKCAASGADAYSDIDAEECQNDKCPYYLGNDKQERYRFERADRKGAIRGLRPYKVTIDMLNNAVKVSE